jgi:hypothetical protein
MDTTKARAALRLVMLYALVDCSYEISRTHVESALAVWEYANNRRAISSETL